MEGIYYPTETYSFSLSLSVLRWLFQMPSLTASPNSQSDKAKEIFTQIIVELFFSLHIADKNRPVLDCLRSGILQDTWLSNRENSNKFT